MTPATAVPLRHVEHCMGTVFSVRVAAPGADPAALRDAMTWLHRMDALLSPFRPDSEISRIDAGSLTVRRAAPEVRQVLAACAELTERTGGWFSARPDGHRLDPCGYVKGWAVQRVADLLTAAGSLNHCVNGGGDVACAGRPEPGRGWRVGVADPHRPHALLTTVEIRGPVGVATSGLAERGAHILDPHTGRAVTSVASVTVVAGDLVTADVQATAAAAMGARRGVAWLAEQGCRALLVEPDGTRHHVGDRAA